jgi:hypothetical protein
MSLCVLICVTVMVLLFAHLFPRVAVFILVFILTLPLWAWLAWIIHDDRMRKASWHRAVLEAQRNMSPEERERVRQIRARLRAELHPTVQ